MDENYVETTLADFYMAVEVDVENEQELIRAKEAETTKRVVSSGLLNGH